MDRFDALQAFTRVVEAGSFTKAAQTLHLSKTTVTQLVQQLEARLRVKLLHRTIARVTEDFEALRFNTAIAALMEFTNAANKWPKIPREVAERFVLLIAPLAVSGPTLTIRTGAPASSSIRSTYARASAGNFA